MTYWIKRAERINTSNFIPSKTSVIFHSKALSSGYKAPKTERGGEVTIEHWIHELWKAGQQVKCLDDSRQPKIKGTRESQEQSLQGLGTDSLRTSRSGEYNRG
jgi:hypothetical protein